MKVMIRLAIIIAALLMVSNVAFADPTNCTGDQVVCYNCNATSAGGQTSYDFPTKFCLNDDGTGNVCAIGISCADYLKLFGGGTGWYNFEGDPPIGGNPNWSLWGAYWSTGGSAIYQPFGDGYLVTGVFFGSGSGLNRSIIHCTKIKCP